MVLVNNAAAPARPDPIAATTASADAQPAGAVSAEPARTRPQAARARKLHVGHFAFMRALVQGIDAKLAWERYLRSEGQSHDIRLVRSTVAWIRAEFAAAARREDRFGTARLVRLDASRLPVGAELPSLEAFAEEAGLEDHAQAEQVQAYEARYGRAAQRLAKRGRLIERQLEALRWLEGLIAQAPRAGDAVASWLNPSLATHIEQADLFTLAQLIDHINGIGKLWYRSIRALGTAKADLIVAWLNEHQGEIGMAVGRHIGQARTRLMRSELEAVVAPASDIRPLEKFIVPAELDGRLGAYRRPQAQCLLKATNDYEAILAWIKSKHGLTPEQKLALRAGRRHRALGVELGMDWLQELSHTQRSYRKEAERFLLWAIVHKGKALSSMTNEDCIDYRDFLADPQPRVRWCGTRSRERWSPLWRPFAGPLSASAQRQALSILKNLYSFLVDQNYLMGNPWSAVGSPRGGAPKVNAGRSLTRAQWAFVAQQLELMGAFEERTSAQQRLGFALHLLYATGLRLSEVVAARVEDLAWVEYPADAADDQPLQGWMLRVVGKGQKVREVPVPVELVSVLAKYLTARGLDPDPEYIGNRTAHLLGKATDVAQRAPALMGERVIDAFEGVAATTLYRQLKGFFGECAQVLRHLGDVKGAERFEKASTHWMRHSHASHAIAAGMPIEIAQQNLGHASLATTTVYVTTESKRRMRAVERFWGRGR